jgi:hypothetical protein
VGKLVRKNVFLDPATLRRVRTILRARTESEAIREALRLVAFRDVAMRGFDRAAGRAPDFGDPGSDG